jgi:hypothetical protein
MEFEYDLINNWEIQSFINKKEDKFIAYQNFGEPGIIIKFKKENIDDTNEKIKLKILVESNKNLLLSGNCLIGKKWVDPNKELELNIELKNTNNYIKLFFREPCLFDWFIIKKLQIKGFVKLNIISKPIIEKKIINENKIKNSPDNIEKELIKNNNLEKENLINNKNKENSTNLPKELKKNILENKLKFGDIFNEKYKTEIDHSRNIFNLKEINQIYISESLSKFSKIKELYNLKEYNNTKESSLFFGLYNPSDIDKLINHNGPKYLMYGGTDCDFRFKGRLTNFERIKDLEINYISISEDIKERLNKKGIKSILVNLNLVDYNLFKSEIIFGK